MEQIQIVDITNEKPGGFALCGYKNPATQGYQKKMEWIRERLLEGLRYKALYSEKEGAVGSIEYIPGENAWRP
ncbi:MAG: hypothetical protein JXA03_14915, partial [Bacteroidales bacterium]|nr:hypothetical protein [Bacteroidales bacterium]